MDTVEPEGARGGLSDTLGFAVSAGHGASDPSVIRWQMHLVAESMQDWEPRADAVIFTAESVVKQTAEHIQRLRHRFSQAQTRLQNDEAAYQRSLNDLASWQTRVQHVISLSMSAIAKAQAATQRAAAAITHWRSELGKAQAWLARAQAREQRAREEVHRAESALSSARSALYRAQSELSAARGRTEYAGKDSEGRDIYRPIDTSAYEAAVRYAQSEVYRCEQWLSGAQHELALAIADRQAAEARVSACEQALQLAYAASQAAATSVEVAENARAITQRGEEEHQRAALLISQAQEKLTEQAMAVEAMEREIQQAELRQQDAVTVMNQARGHHDAARQKSTQGWMEIQWRAEQLRAFDAPINDLSL
jgi:hypothetical protein